MSAGLPEGAPEGFLAPGPRSIRASLSAALDAVGLPTRTSVSTSAEDRRALGLPRAERVCFVLVDGLGAENLAARSGHAPTLRSFTRLEPLTTVAPSTTAAAVTAVGTGELPGVTAMMGYSLRSPSTGRPFSLISWDGGPDPVAWQSAPTLFERLGEEARACCVVQPSRFVGSGLTLAALRGASAVVAETLQDRVEAAGRALREGRRAVYLYWGDVDHVGHSRGFASPEWVAELKHLDAGMGLLARTLPKGTLLVVTADHGMVDVGERIDVLQEPGLAEGVELLAGEERALHVYTGDAARLAERWRGILGGRALVMTKDEALGTGVFGRAGRRAYEAMGDVVSFQASNLSVVDGSLRPPGGARMVGVHGSLTRQEMLVPLIVETV